MRNFVCLLLGLLLAPPLGAPAALASSIEGPPDGVYRYQVDHSEHGLLGSHVVTLATEGDRRRVTVERRLEVTRLLITVYREETSTEELWEEGRLVSFRRETRDGGSPERLALAVRDGQLVFADSGKPTGLPAGTFPTNPWNPEILEETLLFDTDDGSAVRVVSRFVGRESVTVAGERLEASRYEMEGDQRRSLWYDALGRLVRMEIHRGGGETVIFTLEGVEG